MTHLARLRLPLRAFLKACGLALAGVGVAEWVGPPRSAAAVEDWTVADGAVSVTSSKVGIGTSTPQTRLHLDAGSNGPQQRFTVDTGWNYLQFWKEVNQYGGASKAVGLGMNQFDDTGAGSLCDDLVLGTYHWAWHWENRLRVSNGGNIGLGTDAPSARLEVSGGNLKVTGGQILVGSRIVATDGGCVYA